MYSIHIYIHTPPPRLILVFSYLMTGEKKRLTGLPGWVLSFQQTPGFSLSQSKPPILARERKDVAGLGRGDQRTALGEGEGAAAGQMPLAESLQLEIV